MMARKAILGILTVWAVAGQALGTVNLGPVPFADPNFAVRLEFWSTIPGDIQQMTFLGEKLYFGVQPGQVWEYDADGNRQTTPFLDVAAERAGSFGGDPVGSANGLRGIAFHPDYTQMGRPGYGKFYTMHTESFNSAPPTYALDPNWNTTTVMDSVLYEWTFDPTTQQLQGSREVLRVQYPYGDHIGQQIAFNPTVDPNDLDYGKLYLTFGDGGGPCAPSNTCNDLIDNNVAQNTSTVLGSIVRIDPLQDGANPYAIPADNPFVGMPGYLGEIWAYGFRNPQTLSFDTATGKLLVGNISHNNIEEIELIEPGNNYGWAQYEGTYKFAIPGDSSSLTEVPLATRLTDPITYAVTQFDHASNGGTNAVVGGFVYHGAFAEKLEGYYLFGTLSRDRIFIVKESDLVLDEIPTPMYQLPLVDAAGDSIRFGEIVGVGVDGRANMRFGQDQNGEVYVISKANDSIYRFDTRILISIVSQPVDQVVAIGQTASFTVNAIDPLGETLVYQWFFDPDEQINGNEIALQNGDRNGRISGADTATLMVANVDESADRGLYYVEVDTESLPAVTSVKARLAVGGCVAHYTFDDDTANDSSGNGNHGILAGTATIANDPVRGKVLVLDGIGGKVDLGNTASLNITGEITIAAWIKSDVAGDGGFHNIVNRGHGGSPGRELTFRIDSGGNYDWGSWESGRGDRLATIPVPAGDAGTNTWVHLAGTWDGTQWTLYRNGTPVNAFADPDGALPMTVGWAIGARGGVTGFERMFDGCIDDVRIYDFALDAPDIPLIMNPPYPGDIDGDGMVNLIDYGYLNAQWGADGSASPSADIAPCPLGDGIVDIKDLKLLAEHFLESSL